MYSDVSYEFRCIETVAPGTHTVVEPSATCGTQFSSVAAHLQPRPYHFDDHLGVAAQADRTEHHSGADQVGAAVRGLEGKLSAAASGGAGRDSNGPNDAHCAGPAKDHNQAQAGMGGADPGPRP